MNNALPQHNFRTTYKRAGFSLVEVLVVLVVLVIGILAIVRLFPAGFIALRNAQNSTFADRLGQAALESLKQGQGTLPDAIYMYVDAPTTGFNPNVAPDDLYSYTPGANGANTSHQYGLLTDADADINKQRYVSNETFSVPAAHVVNNTMYPPLYAVAFGPIVLPSPATNIGAPPSLAVNSVLWTQQKGDSRLDPSDPNSVNEPSISRHFTNPADTLSPTQGAYLSDLAAALTASTTPLPTLRPTQTSYFVDMAAGQIAVPTASYPQTFTLTVTTYNSVTKVTQTLTPVTLTVPALGFDINANASTGYTGGWFATQDTTAAGTGLPPTSPTVSWMAVTLTRPFQYKGILPAPSDPMPFTADPYEYCLDANNIASGTMAQTTENMGILAFNPIAGGQNGILPLQAQVSYQTLNWHILHENLDVPSGGGTLKLVLDHLKRVGDVQFDGTIFAGLTTDANTPAASQYDLLMLDRDTGDLYAFRGTGSNTAAVEYMNGTSANLTASPLSIVDNGDDPSTVTNPIVLNYAGGRITLPSAFQGKHFRVFYSGDADWAVALQKAPSLYTQTADSTQLSTITSTTPNVFYVPTAGSARVYFPACDAGKTVELDDVSASVTDSSGKTQTRTASLVSQPISLTSDVTGYYVDLGPLGANITQSGDTDITNLTVGGVRGVSVRAVVIWHERSTWNMRATDTLLTRSQP